MDTSNQKNKRGSMSVQMVVLLVPVMFGMMGFAIDLGRLYLVRGELEQAAQSMATAAASRLIGTESALSDANTAARLILDDSSGRGAKYNFGSLPIGGSTGLLSSEVPDPAYYTTAAGAIGVDSSGDSGGAGGTNARHARVTITAEAPLLFWSLLSLGVSRMTTIAAQAAAGVSAPLCSACGIEPFAIGALVPDDAVNFGYTPGVRYSLGFQCSGNPSPGVLAGTAQLIPYLIVNRYNEASTFDESQQLYRVGARGLLPGTDPAFACLTVAGQEIAWVSATPLACNLQRIPGSVTAALCGVFSRMDAAVPALCVNVTDVENLATAYQPDTDLTDIDDYSTYTGAGRRVITVPIVDTLAAGGPMTVLGFRQFLVNPNQGDVNLAVGDINGRFVALYLGSPMPLKQGRFGGCQISSGPGKVVLHR